MIDYEAIRAEVLAFLGFHGPWGTTYGSAYRRVVACIALPLP